MILCGSENKRKFKQRAQLVIIAAVIVAFIESFIKNQDSRISTSPISPLHEPKLPVSPTDTELKFSSKFSIYFVSFTFYHKYNKRFISNSENSEEPRSVFVFVLLGVSATVMITSLTLILLIRFGVIFQQPMRSSLQRGQIDEAL
ncbi:unnamed protein product [Wuchereria bancrofti]|uniref:Uncharacterized protein n=1 Tax=Wuchereria bancrofti TaxID=6293 RepID=A0A3P7EC16_WUCBA|nr:unnamed protein product [Wuchereria bancrofti]